MMRLARTTPFLAPFSDRTAAIYALAHTAALSSLSPRQVEVAYLLSIGQNDKQVAHDLGISPESVRTYVKRILERLNIRDGNPRVKLALLIYGKLVEAWAEVEDAA